MKNNELRIKGGRGKIILFTSFILYSYFLIHSASAAGISVSPAKLDLIVSGFQASAQIVVANPTRDVQVFEIYADDFAENFIFNPASFTLESGERKVVLVTIKK